MTDFDHVCQALPQNDLTSFKTDDVAYVKTMKVNGQTFYAVYDNDGNPLTVFDTRDIAFATIRQYDMEPTSTH